ncbi:unnamed protein product [Camellia sinensis]
MDVDGKRNSSLPSNYVTLVQLQERWLKEQQRKQAESEEEEKRKQREKEEQERKREELEDQMKRHHENVERSNKTNTVPRRRFNVNRGNQSEKSSRTTGVSEKKAEELLIGPIVVHDEERKIDESTKNKSKKKRKPSKEEDQTRAEKKIPVVVNEGKGEKEVNTSEIKRNANNLLVNVMDGEKKVPVDRSLEIGRKLEDLSLSGGKGGHGRSSGKCDKVSGKFHSQKLQKPRDSNLVWVRKGESSGVTVALRSGEVEPKGFSFEKCFTFLYQEMVTFESKLWIPFQCVLPLGYKLLPTQAPKFDFNHKNVWASFLISRDLPYGLCFTPKDNKCCVEYYNAAQFVRQFDGVVVKAGESQKKPVQMGPKETGWREAKRKPLERRAKGKRSERVTESISYRVHLNVNY